MQSAKDICAEIESMLRAGDTDDAVRYSGEELARADNIWRKAYNARAPRAEIIEALKATLRIGISHADALFRAGAYADAFGVTVALLYAVVITKALKQTFAAVSALCYIAVVSLEVQARGYDSNDEVVREHVSTIMSYLASLMYAAYKEDVLHDAEGEVWRPRVYQLLRELIDAGAVQYPLVKVPGGEVDVLDNQTEIMADLAGRARALGLLAE